MSECLKLYAGVGTQKDQETETKAQMKGTEHKVMSYEVNGKAAQDFLDHSPGNEESVFRELWRGLTVARASHHNA